jgi:hypothetical protein
MHVLLCASNLYILTKTTNKNIKPGALLYNQLKELPAIFRVMRAFMFVNKTNNKEVNLRFLIIPILIILVICFSLMANDSRSRLKDPNTAAPAMPQRRAVVKRQILGAATQVFEPSLEMKENIEFLLTPALLAQEAISEDIVITYPTE